ncbi:conserved protein [Methanosarcina mazei Go1]|uniref:Conserved protein n=1 Tax=Methanosarcina mazei (strain ATCC BAA-159 / DSM 3647 / Goe1 / Go1 / JCM 11833 / OCM 88) TaxID=192952 RepID=Q8PSP4_METMA|nr:conserved protein [Methanosarcina mazei Go1]
MRYWIFSLTVRIFDDFYVFPIYTVSNKKACSRIGQVLQSGNR